MNSGVRVSAGKAARTVPIGKSCFDPEGTSELRMPWNLACKPLHLGKSEESAVLQKRPAPNLYPLETPVKSALPTLRDRIRSLGLSRQREGYIIRSREAIARHDSN